MQIKNQVYILYFHLFLEGVNLPTKNALFILSVKQIATMVFSSDFWNLLEEQVAIRTVGQEYHLYRQRRKTLGMNLKLLLLIKIK